MSKFCPITKQKVLYTECLECEVKDKLICNERKCNTQKEINKNFYEKKYKDKN